MADATSSSEVNIAKLIEDIDMLKRDFAAIAEKSSAQVKSSAKDAANRVGSEAQRFYKSAAETGGRSLDALSDEVKERPLVSVMIAFALGYIGGRLMRRR
ncbi:MAG: hypothetical protein ACREFD_06785 [Stellaceae bacterium]